jgi:hypothetical protein
MTDHDSERPVFISGAGFLSADNAIEVSGECYENASQYPQCGRYRRAVAGRIHLCEINTRRGPLYSNQHDVGMGAESPEPGYVGCVRQK